MKKILIILFFLPLFSKAQIISTIAGKGTIGFGGDGGLATAAKMTAPVGIAIDRNGNCYFSGNGRIRKVDTMGIIATVAGDGSTGFSGGPVAATATGLYNPSGIAVDTLGNIFIADKTDHLVLRVDTGGMMSIFAGVLYASGYNGDGIAATTAQLNAPTDVVADRFGNVFITDQSNNRIRRVDNSGTITTVAGNGVWGYSGDGGAATVAELRDPSALALDRNGVIYYADGLNVVRKIDAGGMISRLAGMPDSTGFSGDGRRADSAKLDEPGGIYVDTSGKVFFSDAMNNRIRIVDAAGIITTYAGTGVPGFSGDGGSADTADLDYPRGITGNTYGVILFADARNNRIRQIHGVTSIFGIDSICIGTTTTLSDTTSGGAWSSSNIAVGSIDSLTGVVTGLSGGTTTISYTVAGRYFVTKTITIIAPGAGAVVGPTVICIVGGKYTDSISGGIWSLTDTLIGSIDSLGFVKPRIHWPEEFFDTVMYIVNNGCGIDTALFRVLFVYPCEGRVKNVNSQSDVFIYPNPATTSIAVSAKEKINSIRITDLIGQTVYSNDSQKNEVEVNITDLPAGVYFVKVNGAEVGKFVK